ncbi:hypothetical protein QTP17_28740 [Klebsiella pasteurii]|uniref:hypothetical protein n=1 Tax=Klebsiella pasteurii TaxID=2587529 RepID=UPI002598356F|nr:hypothetical protein [Klebsiella pasteurii]MDM4222714.1 hypothetical protein [Klebsiella pasteurii]
MTTDITELALITKIKNQLKNFDTVVLKEGEALALVEALEKAQADGSEYAASERAEAVKNVALQDEIYGLKSRIAELESRTVTVKLPDYRNTYKSPLADEVEHQVRLALELFSSAAGIKWEDE